MKLYMCTKFWCYSNFDGFNQMAPFQVDNVMDKFAVIFSGFAPCNCSENENVAKLTIPVGAV